MVQMERNPDYIYHISSHKFIVNTKPMIANEFYKLARTYASNEWHPPNK